jgi:hypothetical protein
MVRRTSPLNGSFSCMLIFGFAGTRFYHSYIASARSNLKLANIQNYRHILPIQKNCSRPERPDRRATLKRKKNLSRKRSVDKTSNRNQCKRIDANHNSTYLTFATTGWQLVRNKNIPGAVGLLTITKHLFSGLPNHSEADIFFKVGRGLFAYLVSSVLSNP